MHRDDAWSVQVVKNLCNKLKEPELLQNKRYRLFIS